MSQIKLYPLVILSLCISCGLPDELQVNQNEFLHRMASKHCIVVDVRTAEEYISGHFDGCATMDFYDPNFFSKFKFISSKMCLLLYCSDGTRSLEALQILKEDYGFTKISILRGGINSWPQLSEYFVK